MDDKYLILSLAKREIEKKLERAQADIKKKSEKLRQLDVFRDSKARRRNARIALTCACEERDRWERRLEIVNKWMEEIKNE
ncbi:hypothetical protein [Fonticella tunisiensis]|uniref:Uncharacterized protein n=1 Tax=Fonticella tunisiensis TaxID=1096341 RepID=A0A4R7KTQ1_9CLOT|nr:hypothetical protein [Fonticella tunisiensis]TDT63399.1 hypothetical protein EDD71_102161 [Fonticella tunisiensis]